MSLSIMCRCKILPKSTVCSISFANSVTNQHKCLTNSQLILDRSAPIFIDQCCVLKQSNVFLSGFSSLTQLQSSICVWITSFSCNRLDVYVSTDTWNTSAPILASYLKPNIFLYWANKQSICSNCLLTQLYTSQLLPVDAKSSFSKAHNWFICFNLVACQT